MRRLYTKGFADALGLWPALVIFILGMIIGIIVLQFASDKADEAAVMSELMLVKQQSEHYDKVFSCEARKVPKDQLTSSQPLLLPQSGLLWGSPINVRLC